MRKISFLLAIVMTLTLLFSCQSDSGETADVPTRDLLDAAMALFDSETTHEPVRYYSDAEEGSAEYLDEGYMSYIFYGEFDVEIPALPLIDEFAMAVPSGLYAFEIDILKAKSTAAANEIKALVDMRMENKLKTRGEVENYDSSQLPVLDSCEVYTSGSYVILLATPDNESVKNAIAELLGTGDQLSVTTDNTEETAENNDQIVNVMSHVNTNLTGGETSSAGSSPSENPSEVPEMTVTSYSGNNLIILGGSCVEGAKIHVRGGVSDKVFTTDYGSWIVEVEIAPEGVSNLLVTQEEPGKGESEPISITVKPRTDVDFSSQGVCQVAFGDDMQGHFFGQLADWEGTNLLSDNQIEGLTGRIKTKVDYLAERDCELIYFFVPNPMTVYPETVPERFVKSTADTTRTEQYTEAARAAGATVIDLTDLFKEHRDDEFKLFMKTDSHWTSYGAYLGYYELMSYISESWPEAAPMEIEGNLEFYHKWVSCGDMFTHLGIQNSLVQEYATFVKWLVPTVSNPEIYEPNMTQLTFDRINSTTTIKNTISDADLPTAMIIRDSFSTNIYSFLNNAFAETYWQAMWDYKLDYDYIERTNPDYYIILITERNIDNILG